MLLLLRLREQSFESSRRPVFPCEGNQHGRITRA
jgi:hypothetical protein